MIISLKILLLIFVILVSLDKVITVINILQVNKNFPDAVKDEPYKIEKNPLAKWFFNNLGLTMGTIFYGLISILTLFIAYYLLGFMVRPQISLYIIIMVYGLVLANNFYFLFKYSALIP